MHVDFIVGSQLSTDHDERNNGTKKTLLQFNFPFYQLNTNNRKEAVLKTR